MAIMHEMFYVNVAIMAIYVKHFVSFVHPPRVWRRLKILGVLHLLRVTSNSANYFHLYTADPLLLLSQKVLNI